MTLSPPLEGCPKGGVVNIVFLLKNVNDSVLLKNATAFFDKMYREPLWCKLLDTILNSKAFALLFKFEETVSLNNSFCNRYFHFNAFYKIYFPAFSAAFFAFMASVNALYICFQLRPLLLRYCSDFVL